MRPHDAWQYAPLTPGSGTGSYHIKRLVEAGLLVRLRRGSYGLTTAGRLIVWLDAAVSHQATQGRLDAFEVAVSSAAPAFNAAFPEGSELVIALSQQLQGRTPVRSALRVTRADT